MNASTSVYVCKTCKVYYTPAAAKRMSYKDPMGHKLTLLMEAPPGYSDGSRTRMGSGTTK